MGKTVVLYVCNGEDPNCSKTNCYKNGLTGDSFCAHTSDIRYAKNFTVFNDGTYYEEGPCLSDE